MILIKYLLYTLSQETSLLKKYYAYNLIYQAFLFRIIVKSMFECHRKSECNKYKSHNASVMLEIIYCLRYMGYVERFGWWLFSTLTLLLYD